MISYTMTVKNSIDCADITNTSGDVKSVAALKALCKAAYLAGAVSVFVVWNKTISGYDYANTSFRKGRLVFQSGHQNT